MSDATDPETRLQNAKKRLTTLERERMRAESELENARAEERRARDAANAEFGTSEPEALERMAAEAEAREAEAVSAFERQIAEAEEALAALAGNGDEGAADRSDLFASGD